jgi:hypothetical protein
MSSFNLEAIFAGDSQQLDEAINLAANAQAKSPTQVRQALMLQSYRQLIGTPQLDAQLLPLFRALETPLLKQITHAGKAGKESDHFHIDPGHPLRQTLDALIPAASYWYARDAKPSQQFYDKLRALLENIQQQWQEGTDKNSALAEFSQWLTSENKRAALLEKRLCETELSNQKLAAAQARVIRLINNSLAQRPLPVELHSAIANSLQSELQYWAFTFNSDTNNAGAVTEQPLWIHWQRILPVLGQLFSLGDIQVDDQVLYSQIPALLAELERSLSLATSNAVAYQQWVDLLSRSLMAAVQKQPQEIALFTALSMPEGQSSVNAKVPLTLLQATDAVKVGDWILMRGDDQQTIRCKLSLKSPDLDQLLFVDHTGRKVMSKTNKDFALCLSTGIAQPLRLLPLSDIIHQRLGDFIAQTNLWVKKQLLQQKQKADALVRAFAAEQQAQAENAERERRAEQARAQAELAAREAAAQKALEEARQLASEKAQRAAELAARQAAEQAAEQQRLLDEQQRLVHEQQALQTAAARAREQAALAALNELQVGAWLEIPGTSEATPVRAKLAVMIGSTGKYIFADQVGRKLAEYQREQLIQLLISGVAKVLRNGDNFEDQLAKVIRGLRRDVN